MSPHRTRYAVIALFVASFMVGVLQPAGAQQATQNSGYLGKSRSEYSVFVFGDSLAAGLWAGSNRAAKGNLRLKIKGRFKDGSGLARPQVHDWAKAIPPIIESNPIDIAVVLLGSNDSQPVRQGETKIEFGTDEWNKYYEGRIDQIINVLKSNKIAIYWVELPPMGSAKHNAAIRKISALQRRRAELAKVRIVDTQKAFSNEDGSYTDKGFNVNGGFVRLRSRDGIHFLKSGNTVLAKLVVDAINLDIEVSDGIREAEPDVVAAVEPVDLDGKPIFGHSLNSGDAFTLDPATLPKLDAITIARAPVRKLAAGAEKPDVLTGDAVLKALRTTAIPGSAAGRLFVDGEWPAVPAGRADDFSWPAE